MWEGTHLVGPTTSATCQRKRSKARRQGKGGQTVRSDIVPGGAFPDYALPDHTGTIRKLSELQGRDPLILTLARGNYCPKEHQQHLELAANYPKIAVAYTKIVTIATDDYHTLQEFRASIGAQWNFSGRARGRRTTAAPEPVASDRTRVSLRVRPCPAGMPPG